MCFSETRQPGEAMVHAPLDLLWPFIYPVGGQPSAANTDSPMTNSTCHFTVYGFGFDAVPILQVGVLQARVSAF